MDNRKICRDFDYYVNSESEEVVELGTKEFPYKDLGFVFVEILNYHSHSDRNITIKIKENTVGYVRMFKPYMVNITEVKMEPYSETGNDPDKATVTGLEAGDLTKMPGTSFNLLSHFEERTDEMIYNNDRITDYEKELLGLHKTLLLIMRSSFTMDNMNIRSNFRWVISTNSFFFCVYIQDKLVKLTNIHAELIGYPFTSFDPMNLIVENTTFDYYRTLAGFYMMTH